MVKIIEELIPEGRPNRPGKVLVAKYITIHDTGNSDSGADAKNHSHWVRTNPDPNFLSSWHFTVDDQIIIQQLPLTEHGWHAGDGSNGTGNRQSIGIEICENEDGNRVLAEENAASLCAKLIAEVSTLFPYPDCMKQHYHWTGKDCPRVIRGRPGGWEGFLRRVLYFLEAEKPSLEKAIVLGSYVDFVLAEPLARHLNAPIFLRGALGQLKAREVYIAGGGPMEISGSGSQIIDLSGANRFETAQNIYKMLSK